MAPSAFAAYTLMQSPQAFQTPSPTMTATIPSTPIPTTTPTPSPSPLTIPEIGVFYYVWYGALPFDWKPPKFVDYPVSGLLGNYSSNDPTVIKQQLFLMAAAGIDFAVISWWGYNKSDPYQSFIDNATRQVLQVAKENNINLKFALMVEPYLGNSSFSYNYTEIYNYIYDNFVTSAYSSLYYNYHGQPLVCFFNDPDHVPSLTSNGEVPSDERFNTVLVGEQSYTQWTYNNLHFNNPASNLPHANEISVTPRYDDSRLYRTKSCTMDPNLTMGTYAHEWENAIKLWKERKIDAIMITSWNEYPERTAIEPHKDATATSSDPYYLYNQTKDYIDRIKQLAEPEIDVCMHLGSFTNATAIDLEDLGVKWVRIDWIPGKNMTDFMETMHSNNISVLAIIDINSIDFPLNEWNSTIESKWTAFVDSVLGSPGAEYVSAFEIWNEPNGGAYVSPETYYQMLKIASAIIRNESGAKVVAAGLAPENCIEYLSALYSHNDTPDYVDYQGVHVYGNVAANLEALDIAEQITKKPIWVTEYGMPSAPGPEYTEQKQADFLRDNFAPLQSKAEKIFWYELYDESYQGSMKENSFGLIMLNATRKPAFYALPDAIER